MDLVDEEDVSFAEVRESADEIAGFFEGGAGRAPDIHSQFSGDQLGESRFAETGWAEEERVVVRFASAQRRIDVDAQGVLDPVLADEFGQALGAQREFDDALVGDYFGSCYLG